MNPSGTGAAPGIQTGVVAATKMQDRTRGLRMDWAQHEVKIVHSDELDLNTPQTSGMTRAAAITHARAGASKLWAGTMVVQPDAKTGPHHHGELETVLYVVKGRIRMRWGDQLELSEEARAGRLYLRSTIRAAPGDQRQPR
jgi:uncharacterized RmlC-like cupin family protein